MPKHIFSRQLNAVRLIFFLYLLTPKNEQCKYTLIYRLRESQLAFQLYENQLKRT